MSKEMPPTQLSTMTNPCPRCAELEARLQNFEKETFEKLRARVKELEAALEQNIDAEVTVEGNTVQVTGTVAPTGNPTGGNYMWIDAEGRAWIRTNEGNVYPHPLLKDGK